ncbi:MAG: VanZ family protein [Limisphaerales bacterium]
MPAAGQRAFLVYWFPVLIWMGIIFLMSTGLGSGSNTSRILVPLLNFIFGDVSEETIAALRLVVRKFAHVVEYAILSGLVWRALAKPQKNVDVWENKGAWLTLMICALYAASDEFHQSFVDGRVGTPVDVMIDTVGIVSALAMIWIWQTRRRTIPLG